MILLKALIFFVLGSGVKFVDAAYDDGAFRTTYCLPFSLLLGILAGFSMLWDHSLLIISLSILVGVFLTGKLDILPFQLLATVCLTIALIGFHGASPLRTADWPILLWLSSAAAVDEIGNDLADAGLIRGNLAVFFFNRGYLKLLALLFVTIHYLSFQFLVSFLSFDLGYFLLTAIARHRPRLEPEPNYIQYH